MIAKKTVLILGAMVVVGDLLFRLATTPDRIAPPSLRVPSEPEPTLSRLQSQTAVAVQDLTVDGDRESNAGPNPPSGGEPKRPNAPPVLRSAPAAASARPMPEVTPEAYYSNARAALSLVGADQEAEEFWISAINDPGLSAKQREDLIEDLNEEGFEDPRNPTEDELPLIVNRLQLIEDLASDAMDQVNANSFAEAYKDLLNMYIRLTRR